MLWHTFHYLYQAIDTHYYGKEIKKLVKMCDYFRKYFVIFSLDIERLSGHEQQKQEWKFPLKSTNQSRHDVKGDDKYDITWQLVIS